MLLELRVSIGVFVVDLTGFHMGEEALQMALHNVLFDQLGFFPRTDGSGGDGGLLLLLLLGNDDTATTATASLLHCVADAIVGDL